MEKRISLKLQRAKSYDGSEVVLIVDEDRFVRNLLKRTLSMHGYHVLTAADAREALQEAQEHAGPIHLMVTDILLSATDGPELARKLSQERPGMRTLYVSGFYRSITSRSACPEEQFLAKPFSPDELLQKVRGLLDKVCSAA